MLITFSTGNTIEFLYDAAGNKLRKTTKTGATVQYVQDYFPGGIEYRQTGTGAKRVESVYHAEGRYYNTNVDASNTCWHQCIPASPNLLTRWRKCIAGISLTCSHYFRVLDARACKMVGEKHEQKSLIGTFFLVWCMLMRLRRGNNGTSQRRRTSGNAKFFADF